MAKVLESSILNKNVTSKTAVLCNNLPHQNDFFKYSDDQWLHFSPERQPFQSKYDIGATNVLE